MSQLLVNGGGLSALHLQPGDGVPDVVALGAKTLVVIEGLSLMQCLKYCASRAARGQSFDPESIDPQIPPIQTKRWDISAVEEASDFVPLGAFIFTWLLRYFQGMPHPILKYL
jgi:hypothetical protein